jgi:hypothetical protein
LQRPCGVEQFGDGVFLQYKGADAEFERLVEEALPPMHGEDHHGNLEPSCLELAGNFESVGTAQFKVENDDVRP